MKFGIRQYPHSLLLQLLLTIAAAIVVLALYGNRRVQAQMGTVATVSAASFAANAAVAPDSIVAAFGQKLATGTQVAGTQPLPTSLGGSTVRVNGQLAQLFFVSPGQINFAIPAGIPAGMATVSINAGDGSVSQGTMQIAAAAPGIFSANADGAGVPAAVLVRVASNGVQTIEPVMQFNSTLGRQVPRPIDLGPEGERVFLVLFLSGLRGAADPNGDGDVRESSRLLIGGMEVSPSFASRQPGLAGLDQMNTEIPRSLIGRGIVNLAVSATGAVTSNLTEIEIAARPSSSAPVVNAFNPGNVLAGTDMTITGAGFSSTISDLIVRIGGTEATVLTANSNQLTVKVPYGAVGGPIAVRSQQAEGSSPTSVTVRTSISGFLEDTNRQPISGVTAKLRNTTIMSTTSAEGSFILPDVTPAPLALVDIDPSTAPGGLPYPAITVRKDSVLSNRDNMIERPVALESATGPSINVGSGGTIAPPEEESPENTTETSEAAEPSSLTGLTGLIQIDGITLEIPSNATAMFPNGQTAGQITLTAVRNSRTPVNLPPGVFSSSIAQITPFGVKLAPGGKLTFPNPDGIPTGTQARLYKFDQSPNSPTIGSFINLGPASVSADGKVIETQAGAITETSYYFVAIQRPTTTVLGRVLESDGKTPVRRALVKVRGQEAFTDGNGGFILRQVPASAGERLSVEASIQRATGRVDRAQSVATPAVVDGITQVGAILLPAPQTNLPPTITGLPNSLVVTENIDRRFNFQVFDPNPNQALKVSAGGANFVSLIPGNGAIQTMLLSPKTGAAGRYTISVTAVDNLDLSRTLSFPLRVNRPPVANPQTVQVVRNLPKSIVLTGSDPDGDPINFVADVAPKNGKISGAAPNLTYTPNTGFVGTDQFFFKANDGYADSPSVRVIVVVEAPAGNNPPVLTVPGSQSVLVGNTITFDVKGEDKDVEQILSLTADGMPTGATLTRTGQNPITGVFSWKTPAGGPPSVTITFSLSDNGSPKLSDTKSVTIRLITLGLRDPQ